MASRHSPANAMINGNERRNMAVLSERVEETVEPRSISPRVGVDRPGNDAHRSYKPSARKDHSSFLPRPPREVSASFGPGGAFAPLFLWGLNVRQVGSREASHAASGGLTERAKSRFPAVAAKLHPFAGF